MRLSIRIGKRKLNAEVTLSTMPYIPVAGISSRCKDRMHVLFLEYDGIVRWLVEDELEWLCQRFNLTPFYLFRSSGYNMSWNNDIEYGNYHAICLTKLAPADIMEIQRHTHIDHRYTHNFNVNLYRGNVLRMSDKGEKGKPVFLACIGPLKERRAIGKVKSKEFLCTVNREISTAHMELLEGQYKSLTRIHYRREDGCHEPVLVTYLTAHK